MAYGIIDDQVFEDIAAAIRSKNGSENKYEPSEMADAIKELSTTLVINVSEDGVVTATCGRLSAAHKLSNGDDADFLARNIKSGVTIFGVTGTYSGAVDPDPVPDPDPEPGECDHSNVRYEGNNESTHTKYCVDCGANLGEESHGDYRYTNNGNGTHKVLCGYCGYDVDNGESCTYVNGTCTKCGALNPCEHPILSLSYKSNGDGSHRVTCNACGDIISYGENCTFAANGVCVNCGYSCPHESFSNIYSSNGDGTHFVKCGDCGSTLDDSESCTYVNGICTKCGAFNPCEHPMSARTYVPNGDGTHDVICGNCGETEYRNENCTFGESYKTTIEGGDYLVQDCVHCGYQHVIETA